MKKKLHNLSRLKKSYILIMFLVIILVGVLFLRLTLFSGSVAMVACESDDPIVLAEANTIYERLNQVGLSDSRFMNSTGIDKHIQRLCSGDVTPDILYTYANHVENLNEIGRQYGEPIPAAVWDVHTREMDDSNVDVYQNIDTLVGSQLEYAHLLIRAYNRFYNFKQNQTADTALDTALDIFLYTVEYYDQITDEDFGKIDESTARELGTQIVKTWQELIGFTARTNPLTGDPLFPPSPYAHFNITNMWRHQIHNNSFIGLIWGISGFDSRFVGDPKNTNQVEHVAITMSLQYVYEYSLTLLNALEVRDTFNGKQDPESSFADQNINNIIATEFIPRFEAGYVHAIEHLRCVLSNPERIACA